ncbi:MAG: sel1 repeat family protein [Oligoflexia bacterium]|nr:sel1 repeat family protein [Oligoflexia bacterium]
MILGALVLLLGGLVGALLFQLNRGSEGERVASVLGGEAAAPAESRSPYQSFDKPVFGLRKIVGELAPLAQGAMPSGPDMGAMPEDQEGPMPTFGDGSQPADQQDGAAIPDSEDAAALHEHEPSAPDADRGDLNADSEAAPSNSRFVSIKAGGFEFGQTVTANSAASAEMEQEFAAAKLSRADLDLLARTDLDSGNIEQEQIPAIQKLIRLFFYGKQLGKSDSLAVLLDRVHPSLQRAVLENPDLQIPFSPSAPKVAAPAMPAKLDVPEPNLSVRAPAAPSSSNSAADFERGRAAANRSDYASAREIWEPLAISGYAKAQTALGRMYARGDGVKKNFATARAWFEKASEQNDSNALLMLGKLYMNGDGVLRDTSRAADYFRRAAALGNSEADTLLRNLRG